MSVGNSHFSNTLVLNKVATDKTVAEQFGEDAVVLGFMPDAAGDDGRVNAEFLRQGNDILCKVAGAGCRLFPSCLGNQGFLGHVVCLALFAVLFVGAFQIQVSRV